MFTYESGKHSFWDIIMLVSKGYHAYSTETLSIKLWCYFQLNSGKLFWGTSKQTPSVIHSFLKPVISDWKLSGETEHWNFLSVMHMANYHCKVLAIVLVFGSSWLHDSINVLKYQWYFASNVQMPGRRHLVEHLASFSNVSHNITYLLIL